MMGEQQFVLDKLYYTIMTPIEKISVGRNYMTYGEVVGCLNEQQSTIINLQGDVNRLNYIIEELRTKSYKQFEKINGLQKKNEKLKKGDD